MKRRDILKYTALTTGAALSAPLAAILLSGCRVEPEEDYLPQFFQKEEFDLIKNLADLILPRTDSPSATDVGVHRVIDKMIGEVYKPEDREDFKMDFSAFAEKLKAEGFFGLKQKEQTDYLQRLELSENPPVKEKSENPEERKPRSARDVFIDIKQQTISYYLSTEKIATEFLNYLPVPGEYEPCISLEEAGGKKWAL